MNNIPRGEQIQAFDPPKNLNWLVVPLVPGTKIAKRSRDGKQSGWKRAKYREHPELTVVMTLGELMERAREFAPFDIGILLEYNGLVLMDGDKSEVVESVQLDEDTTIVRFGDLVKSRVVDGPANLKAFEAEHEGVFPETYEELSPGDPGRHDRGVHKLYWQNPDEPIKGHWWIAPGVEVKTSGIVRIALVGDKVTTTVNSMYPVMLPAEAARLLTRSKIIRSGSAGAGSEGVGTGQDPDLFRLAGTCWKDGLAKEAAYEDWKQLAASFPLENPDWPWTRADFDRHWGWWESSGILPGQTVFNTYKGGEDPSSYSSSRTDLDHTAIGVKNSSSSHDTSTGIFISDPADIMKKLSAEQNSDILSRDWSSAPQQAAVVYEQIMLAFHTGEVVTAADFDSTCNRLSADAKACLTWMSSQDHPLLQVYQDRIVALADPDYPDDRPRDNYPGWTYSKDPKAGSRFDAELADSLVLEIRVAAGARNARLSARQVARAINSPEFRETHGLGDYRAFTIGHVGRSTKRLVEANKLYISLKKRRYRQYHRWATLPALYLEGPKPFRLRLRDMEPAETGFGRFKPEYQAWIDNIQKAAA